jgi:iron-sulfur cluster repair protein YtfE (RIC family)
VTTMTLPQATHEHHEKLLQDVNRIPEVADALLVAPEAPAGIQELSTFLHGTLLPHVEAAEGAVYPQLERILQNRHSMSPMRKEHEEIRRLVGTFGALAADVRDGRLSLGRKLALRRVMFQLYALLKVHIAEEEAYVRLVDRGAGTEMSEAVAAAMAHPVAR